MDSRLVRYFAQIRLLSKPEGRRITYLLLLRKDCLFCHRSECYGPPSPSISLESIKSHHFDLKIVNRFLGEPMLGEECRRDALGIGIRSLVTEYQAFEIAGEEIHFEVDPGPRTIFAHDGLL